MSSEWQSTPGLSEHATGVDETGNEVVLIGLDTDDWTVFVDWVETIVVDVTELEAVVDKVEGVVTVVFGVDEVDTDDVVGPQTPQ